MKCSNIAKKQSTITPSNEEGFSCSSDNWFDDKQYYQSLQGKSDIYHEKDYYFNSYSSYYIHQEMLNDKERTGAYQNAIMNNKELFKDKIVLDIGAGTGVLSIFAAKAGAKHVYALEFADIADYAKEIISRENLSGQITVIKSKVEEADLPVKKVDIIISEWMGYFLLYESMLDTVLFARDKWLDKDGVMFPDRAKLYLAAISDSSYRYERNESWQDIYGFDMSCLKNLSTTEVLIDVTRDDFLISSRATILDINLYTVTTKDLDFSAGYEIVFTRDDKCSGLVFWFDVEFGERIPNKVVLRTGPYDHPTHWKQCILYMNKDVDVRKNQKLIGDIAVIKDTDNFRQINTRISYSFPKQKTWMQIYTIA